MKSVFYLVLLLLSLQSVSGIRINEIMYNPVSSDNNHEFVEIFGTDNLSGCTIGDLASNDSLELIRFWSGNFSLIVEEGFNHSGINCSVYSAGATIGNNLNNDGDTVFLYYNNSLIDFVGYDGSLADNNGFSLELINNSWFESCELGGSAGKENCKLTNTTINQSTNQSNNDTINQTTNSTTNNTTNQTEYNNSASGLKLEIIISDTLFIGLIYDSLFKITNLNHTSGAESFVNVTVKYNVTENDSNNTLIKEDCFNKTINYYSSANTGKLFFEETGIYVLCGTIINTNINVCKAFSVINPIHIPCFVEINLSTDNDMYLNREKVKIKNMISNKTFPYIIEYWVEDLFGEEVKKKYNTSNTNQKTWTPKIVEKDRVFYVKNKLVFVACNNFNTNLINEKMIIVKKEKSSIGVDDDTDSSISIDYVYLPLKETLKFGDNFKVKLSIYKGDTAKSVINVFVKNNKYKVSEYGKFYLNKKDSDYNITVIVFLKPDCDEKFGDGIYHVVVEGLGKEISEEIEIKDNKKGVCKEEAVNNAGKIVSFYTRTKKYNDLINLYANIEADDVHELILISSKEELKQIINASGKIKLEAKPEPGTNLFLLQLKKDKEVVDTKTLLVELEGEEEQKSMSRKVLLAKDNDSIKETNLSVNYSAALITGGVVYESDNTKMLKYSSYFIILVLTIVIVGLIVSKKQKNIK